MKIRMAFFSLPSFNQKLGRVSCKWLASPEETNGAKQQYLDKLECLGLVGQNYRKYPVNIGLEISIEDVQFLLLLLLQPGRKIVQEGT